MTAEETRLVVSPLGQHVVILGRGWLEAHQEAPLRPDLQDLIGYSHTPHSLLGKLSAIPPGEDLERPPRLLSMDVRPPMDSTPFHDKVDLASKVAHQRLVGKLLWIANHTRPLKNAATALMILTSGHHRMAESAIASSIEEHL